MCFETKENGLNKLKKHTIKAKKTQTGNTFKTKGLGLV